MLRMPFVVVALLVLLAPAARADGASSAQAALKAAQDLTSYADGVVKKNERPVIRQAAGLDVSRPGARRQSPCRAAAGRRQRHVLAGAVGRCHEQGQSTADLHRRQVELGGGPARRDRTQHGRLRGRHVPGVGVHGAAADPHAAERRPVHGRAETRGSHPGAAGRVGENPQWPYPVRPGRAHHHRSRRQTAERQAPDGSASRDGANLGAPHQRGRNRAACGPL